MSNNIKEAFFEVCTEAEPPKQHFVSLYVNYPFYGGPEEGGWWGSDTIPLAHHHCTTEKHADSVLEAVQAMEEKLNKQAKREYGDRCLRETEWLEARGLDDSFLPEVNGEVSYLAVVEETPGEHAHRGCRHYE